MNYLEIILSGYLNPNTRKYLGDYFIRECDAAKTKGYSPGEFFDGIKEAVSKLDADITQQLNDDKKVLNQALAAAKKSHDQQSSEEILKELSRLNRSDYTVNLSKFPGYKGSLDDQDIQNIRLNLLILSIHVIKGKFATLKQQGLLATPKQQGLTMKQIALIHIYEGNQITRKNGDEIVKAYGLTSGEKLYSTYLEYVQSTDRTGDPGTPRKLKGKIKLIESVVQLLTSEDAVKRATAELEILKRIHY